MRYSLGLHKFIKKIPKPLKIDKDLVNNNIYKIPVRFRLKLHKVNSKNLDQFKSTFNKMKSKFNKL